MKINQFLKFEPILKEKVWGGNKLTTLLNKSSLLNKIGESWEVSNVKNNISIVANSTLKGTPLNELLKKHKSDLVGKKVYKKFGDNFPLLIKFIDANKPLSIQVHPNDELAKKRHNSFGKTEMWYVLDAEDNANIIIGFNKKVSKQEYLNHLNHKTLTDILNVDTVNSGDVYFIPTGRIHAIGAGVLLAEIQQSSDITYRVYDWDRPNLDGSFRELHTEEAMDAIDFSVQESYKTTYTKKDNQPSELVDCSYFTTNFLSVNGSIEKNNALKDSFVIYMCVKGNVEFSYKDHSEILNFGQTILVPASLEEFMISSDRESELLEIYIK